ATTRSASPRRISSSSTTPRCFRGRSSRPSCRSRGSMRRRTTIRTSSSATRTIPTSSTTICRSWSTSRASSRRSSSPRGDPPRFIVRSFRRLYPAPTVGGAGGTMRMSAAIAICLLGGLVPLAGQSQTAKLLVTVTDETGAVIPGATVTATPAEGAAIKPAATSDKGLATLDGLAPGRYTVRAEFTGFDAGTLKDVRLRPGDNRHVVMLRVSRLEESVTVARDAQTVAADPHGNAFRTVLSREEIEAL